MPYQGLVNFPHRGEEDDSWVNKAACRGMDVSLFFVEGSISALVADTCAVCIVKKPCGQYATKYNLPGYWGGMTHQQRRKIRRAGQA